MRRTLISWVLLFSCNLMWSLQFTCIKLTQDQVGPLFTVWGPMLLATIFLYPFARKEFVKGKKSWKDIRVFVLLVLLGTFPAQVFVTKGTQLSLASNAAILTMSLPVITALFAFLILKEKMNRVRWISFAIAIVGVLLASMNDLKGANFGSQYVIGNFIILLAIIGNAFYNTGCKKIIERFTPVEMVFFTYLFMVIFLTPLVLYFERDVFARVPSFTTQTWLGLSLLTFFHNFLSMILFFKALKKLEAIQVALSNYLITFFGLPIAAIWLKEKLHPLAIVGGVLIFVSTLIITIIDYRIDKRKAEEGVACSVSEKV
ncbi:MAG: DMT family transporter [Bacteroidota bacterium]|nr:DMT family transporter [Bacteroidota bacterium]